MKFQMVTKYFLPVKAGIETHVYEVGKRMAKENVDVGVYTLNRTFDTRNSLADMEVIQGMMVHRFRSHLSLALSLDYEEPIYLNNFDISLSLTIFLRGALRRLRGKRSQIIIIPHGGINPYWSRFSIPERIVKKTYTRLCIKLLVNPLVSAVIALNEWEKNQLMMSGVRENRVKIIPNGICEMAFAEKPIELKDAEIVQLTQQRYIITVCRVAEEKNIEGAIKALAQLEGLNLVVCGALQDKRYLGELRKLIEKLGLEGRVSFSGYVSEEAKFYLIDRSEAFVLLSWWECDPISVKESMPRGRPIVVSNRGAMPFIIKDGINGFVADPEDLGSVITCIRKAITLKSDERESMKAANMADAENYRWEEVTDRILQLVKEK